MALEFRQPLHPPTETLTRVVGCIAVRTVELARERLWKADCELRSSDRVFVVIDQRFGPLGNAVGKIGDLLRGHGWMSLGVGASDPLPPTVAASLIFERAEAT
jgi:hypothetical protein